MQRQSHPLFINSSDTGLSMSGIFCIQRLALHVRHTEYSRNRSLYNFTFNATHKARVICTSTTVIMQRLLLSDYVINLIAMLTMHLSSDLHINSANLFQIPDTVYSQLLPSCIKNLVLSQASLFLPDVRQRSKWTTENAPASWQQEQVARKQTRCTWQLRRGIIGVLR